MTVIVPADGWGGLLPSGLSPEPSLSPYRAEPGPQPGMFIVGNPAEVLPRDSRVAAQGVDAFPVRGVDPHALHQVEGRAALLAELLPASGSPLHVGTASVVFRLEKKNRGYFKILYVCQEFLIQLCSIFLITKNCFETPLSGFGTFS